MPLVCSAVGLTQTLTRKGSFSLFKKKKDDLEYNNNLVPLLGKAAQ